MAYLNTRYGGDLGVLWVNAHPDVTTPREMSHAHAQVLGALLGRGDSDLVGEVDTQVKPSRVMYAGLDAWMPVEGEFINGLGLRCAGFGHAGGQFFTGPGLDRQRRYRPFCHSFRR